ncbi:hypothetical protein RRG08_052488 [Elysia crispata]|uniref:Uncharacterized protein n=1 Tax=Elysia crispata TaxID=231223 RepID=A0AAE1B140_9GAST|nr:hypothetical protein RRG08_052488 [Elysia crispata]
MKVNVGHRACCCSGIGLDWSSDSRPKTVLISARLISSRSRVFCPVEDIQEKETVLISKIGPHALISFGHGVEEKTLEKETSAIKLHDMEEMLHDMEEILLKMKHLFVPADGRKTQNLPVLMGGRVL